MVARTADEIDGLLRANRATASLLQELACMSRPGMTTRELDNYAMQYITRLGATPVFFTEEGFPGCINTSVNDAVVHGVPGDQRLVDGDILSIDAGMTIGGYCGDATITVPIGEISPRHRRLVEATGQALEVGIRAAAAGRRVGDIGHAIQTYARSQGFGVVREYVGHGLGRRMHEKPLVPSIGRVGTGPLLTPGLIITIEPILVEKSTRCRVAADGWTVLTIDGGWAAQFEHTVMVQRDGGRILSAC